MVVCMTLNCLSKIVGIKHVVGRRSTRLVVAINIMTKTQAQKQRAKAAKLVSQAYSKPGKKAQPVVPGVSHIAKVGNTRFILKRDMPARTGNLAMMPAGAGYAKMKRSVLSLNDVTAAAIALPHEFSPIRVADEYSTKHTSIASPYFLETLDASTQVSRMLDVTVPGTMVFFLFKDTARAYARSLVNTSNKPYNYAAMFVTFTLPSASLEWNYGGEMSLPLCHFKDTNVGNSAYLHPHGDILYCGDHGGKKGVWMNAGEVFTINVSAVPTGGELTIYILRGKTWVNTESVALTTTLSYTMALNGYYSFSLNDTTAAGGTGTVNYVNISNATSFPTVLGFLPLPGVVNKAGVLSASRTIGASLLVSNVSQQLKRGGVCNMSQVSPGADLANILAYAPTYSNQDPSSSYTGTWDFGVYGYITPIGPEDFMFKEPFTTSVGIGSSTMLDCSFELVPDLGFLVATVTSAVDTTTYPSNVCLVTVSYGVEFITNDNWFVADTSRVSVDQYKHGLVLLKTIPQFHENPLHIKQLLQSILAGGKNVLRYGPAVLAALTSIVPEAAPITAPAGASMMAMRQALKRYGMTL